MSEPGGGGEGPRINVRTLMKGEADADGALRRLLQAYAGPVGMLPLAEARALFAAGEVSGPPDDGLLAHRATFCLARALEEHARLALMDWDPLRHALEVFLSLEIQELKSFFARCRRGLSDEQLCRVGGLCNADAMRKVRGLSPEQLAGHEEALAFAAAEEAESLKELARLYHCSAADADPTLGPWQMGFGGLTYGSVYLPPLPPPKGETDTAEEEDDSKGEVWIGLQHVGGEPATLSWSPARATTHLAEEVLVMLQEICSRTQRMARLKLALLDDPAAGLKAAEEAFAAERERRKEEEARSSSLREHAEHDRAVAEAEALAKAQFEKAKAQPQAGQPRPAAAKPEPAPPPAPTGEPGQEPTKQVRQVGGLKIIHSQKLHEQT